MPNRVSNLSEVMNDRLKQCLAVAVLLALSPCQQAAAEGPNDQRCASGDDVRRIEIRFADDDGSLPCRVIYRPEADSETVGIVSWRGIPGIAACQAQAKEVIDRLEGEGWTCAADTSSGDQLAVVRAQDAAAPKSESTPAGPASPADKRPTEASQDQSKEALPREDFDEPARFVKNPDIAVPSGDLSTIVRSDLNRLDITLDGRLEAEIAGYGDLNDDNLEDALVLFTYVSPQPAYRQFLAAYMFDGQIYRLAATKPVGSNISATMEAKVEAIDQGVVHVSLRAFEPGDRSCCPTGTRYLALALHDLDLVEIDADVPTR